MFVLLIAIISPILLVLSDCHASGTIQQPKHLRLIASEYSVSLMVERAANLTILSAEGVSVEMIQWLAKFDQFTYSFEPINSEAVENTSQSLGSIYYIHTNQADLVIGSLIMSSFRYQYIDFPHPWMEESAVLVIPVPDDSVNIGGIWQPFQWPVWVVILASLLVVIVSLNFTLSPRNSGPINDRFYNNDRINKLGLYVFGLLLSQGGFLRSSRLANRLVAGVWCLATLVLVQAYSSTLISFVTTPTTTPLIKSPEDLANQPNINLVVQKFYGTEVLLLNAQDPLSKKLGDKMKSYSKSRCMLMQECLDLVASGNRLVLIHGYGSFLEGMYGDYQLTNKCRFSLAKQILSTRSYAWGIAKNSPFTESFNRGILQMMESGLIMKWTDKYQLKPRRCMDQLGNRVGKAKNHRLVQLTLKNFMAAFAFLSIGCLLSLWVFIFEKIRYSMDRRPRRDNSPTFPSIN